MNSQKIIPVVSVAAGGLLIITGLIGIVSYIITVIESSSLADQSLIFWHLPFFLFGFIFLVVGVLFIVMGIRSLNGSEKAYKTIKVLLIILFAIIILIIGLLITNTL